MKKQLLTSFYVEALLLIAAFVAMVLVLTAVFGTARAKSVEAYRLTRAVTLAANAAEAVSAADSLEQAAALLDEGGNVRLAAGQIEAAYHADGSPCPDGSGALRLTVSWEPSPEDAALVVNRIAVFSADTQAVVYTLETACFRKGAAA
ncbi:MAG: hypothetical protein IJH48_03885 [Oscillospiraceae bacterium]|nr:hypothetical protein [Oscillospiraceae bacterium]